MNGLDCSAKGSSAGSSSVLTAKEGAGREIVAEGRKSFRGWTEALQQEWDIGMPDSPG
jgi:hypothetical protein